MKAALKFSGQLFAGTILMLITWMIGLSAGDKIIPANFAQSDASPEKALLAILLVSLLNTTILTIMIKRSKWHGWNLIWAVALVLYGIQFFMSMIEGIAFNDALQMPVQGFYSILVGGLIFVCMISPLLVILNGKMKRVDQEIQQSIPVSNLLIKSSILAIIVYPSLYFLAGYYIAWQSEELRVFYSGSPELLSFFEMMQANFNSGLVYFQFLRGFLWLAIGWPVFQMLKGNKYEKGVIIGLLFAMIMNTQHIIPNPYMPGEIPMYHFIETASSNFIWGFLIVQFFVYNQKKTNKYSEQAAS